MNEKDINSIINAKLPSFRSDITTKKIQKNGDEFILLKDDLGFALNPILIQKEYFDIAQLFNGINSAADIFPVTKSKTVDSALHIVEIAFQLVQMGFLATDEYSKYKDEVQEYLRSDIRQFVCAGNSYPKDTNQLSEFLDYILSLSDIINTNNTKIPKAIISPHLDFMTGYDTLKTYSLVYNKIKDFNADVFVIFGTSHYANSDLFMFTRKHYTTPFGVVDTDNILLDEIISLSKTNIYIDDIAHKPEHSIEFQVLMLKHIFRDRKFKILPILTGSLHKYFDKLTNPGSDPHFLDVLRSINTAIANQKKRAIYIAGADLSHIGRKFDDDFNAADKLNELKDYDRSLLNSILKTDADTFFEKIANINDANKVCGLAPIFSLLKIINSGSAEILQYGQWNEIETKSAVSFAGAVFYAD